MGDTEHREIQLAAGSRQQEERRKFKGEGVEVVETVKVVIR